MEKYNRAMDLLIVSAVAYKKHRHMDAARCFAAAMSHPSITEAVHILEANNRYAAIAEQKAIKAGKKKVKAEVEVEDFAGDMSDEDLDKVLETLGDDFEVEDTEEVEEVEDTEEVKDTEEVETEDEEAEEEVEAEVEEVEVEVDGEDEEDIDDELAELEARAKRIRAARAAAGKKSTFARILKGMK